MLYVIILFYNFIKHNLKFVLICTNHKLIRYHDKIPEMFYVKVKYESPFTYNIFLHKYFSLLLEVENLKKKTQHEYTD